MWTGEKWRRIPPYPGPDATLWTGPEPDLAELGEIIGVSTSPLAELPSVLDQAATATLPAPDVETCVEQSTLLGREIRPAKLAAIDETLADAVIALRLIHYDAAIAGLRQAALATEAAHRAGLRATRAGVRESAVQAALEAELVARNMTTSFSSIVSAHGEVLHNEAHHHTLAQGDLLLVDAGGRGAGLPRPAPGR